MNDPTESNVRFFEAVYKRASRMIQAGETFEISELEFHAAHLYMAAKHPGRPVESLSEFFEQPTAVQKAYLAFARIEKIRAGRGDS